MSRPLTDLPATALASLLRQGEVSPVEVARAFLDRIAALDCNAVAWCDPDWTLAQARALGPPSGPLWGVPFSVKDSLAVAGSVTTFGTLGQKGKRCQSDATAVARLRSQGMVVLCKTSVPELCMGLETDNALLGPTLNPRDPARTCGGSSGGEAALLAAGASPLGLGSDTGGSIRLPAHYCGVWGLKPTTGRVPRTGHTPGPGGPSDGLWQIGPMGRHPEDLRAMLALLQGPDGHDPEVVAAAEPAPPASLRVGWWAEETTPETRAAVLEVVEALGLPAEEVAPPGLEEAAELLGGIFLADEGLGLRRLLEKLGTAQPHRVLAEFFQLIEGQGMSAAAYCHLRYRWARLRARALEFSERYPVLVGPVTPGPARRHGTSAWSPEMLAWMRYAAYHNLTGWPALSAPVGRSPEGLPIGVQMATPPWHECLLLDLANRLLTRVHKNVTSFP